MSDPIHDNKPEEIKYFTPNYKLPLWQHNTVTSWLIQMNYAMTQIDTVMHNLALRTSIDGDIPEELISAVEKLESQVNELQATAEKVVLQESQIASIDSRLTTAQADISTLMINYKNLDTRMNTAENVLSNLQNEFDKLQETFNQHITEYNSLADRVAALEAGS